MYCHPVVFLVHTLLCPLTSYQLPINLNKLRTIVSHLFEWFSDVQHACWIKHIRRDQTIYDAESKFAVQGQSEGDEEPSSLSKSMGVAVCEAVSGGPVTAMTAVRMALTEGVVLVRQTDTVSGKGDYRFFSSASEGAGGRCPHGECTCEC